MMIINLFITLKKSAATDKVLFVNENHTIKRTNKVHCGIFGCPVITSTLKKSQQNSTQMNGEREPGKSRGSLQEALQDQRAQRVDEKFAAR
jgi:hypothetical protein